MPLIAGQKPIELPPAPPPAPRPLTPAVRRRSLHEPNVRFWWLTAIVILAVAIYFLVTRTMNWMEELKIVKSGVPVSATIVAIGDGEVQGQNNINPAEYPAMLQFQYNNREYTVKGFLEGRHEPIALKLAVPIKVDPDSPAQWTSLTTAPPIGHALLSAGLVAPFAIVAAIVSFVLRHRVLKIWQTGSARPYVVESTSQTALAPSSRVVRCRAADNRDRQLVSVFIPLRLFNPKPGDLLWLIHPPSRPSSALPAIAYE